MLRQRAVAAVAMGVLSLLGLALGLGNVRRGVFVAVVTLLFAAVAIWLGVGAGRRARRSGTARPRGSVTGIVLGVFWPQLITYANCMSKANTVAGQHACHTQLDNSVGGEISVLQNGR